MPIKKGKYLNLRDKCNLMIALDCYILDVESRRFKAQSAASNKRYLKYLRTLRKKL